MIAIARENEKIVWEESLPLVRIVILLVTNGAC